MLERVNATTGVLQPGTIYYPTVQQTRLLSDKLVARMADRGEEKKWRERVAEKLSGSLLGILHFFFRRRAGWRVRWWGDYLQLITVQRNCGKTVWTCQQHRARKKTKGNTLAVLLIEGGDWQCYSVLSHERNTIISQCAFLFIIPLPKKWWLVTWITAHQLPYAEWRV